ncbi:MAG: DUF3789 domain-containing protein [Deltaproteobacteria bacterium]|nr:DUF3789 domain-containing protein [Deltaproteobacteria bacterium]
MSWVIFLLGVAVGSMIGITAMCIVFSGREHEVSDRVTKG